MTIAVRMADPGDRMLINCKGRTVGTPVRPFQVRAIASLVWLARLCWIRPLGRASRPRTRRAGWASTILNELAEFLDSGQAGPVVVGTSDMGAMIEGA
jgi:hypothetical protein